MTDRQRLEVPIKLPLAFDQCLPRFALHLSHLQYSAISDGPLCTQKPALHNKAISSTFLSCRNCGDSGNKVVISFGLREPMVGENAIVERTGFRLISHSPGVKGIAVIADFKTGSAIGVTVGCG
jgi:hypothetical protein